MGSRYAFLLFWRRNGLAVNIAISLRIRFVSVTVLNGGKKRKKVTKGVRALSTRSSPGAAIHRDGGGRKGETGKGRGIIETELATGVVSADSRGRNVFAPARISGRRFPRN